MTEGLPALPERLTRWTVDRHLTSLVDHLRQGGSPAAVSDHALETLREQVREAFPHHELPPYIATLGEDPDEDLALEN